MNATVNIAIHNAHQLCQANGKRMTPLRETVLRLLYEQVVTIGAYQLLAHLKKVHSHAQPMTLYRTLDFLLKMGLVHKISHSGEYFCCAHPNQHTTCQVLLCTQCKKVQECCDDVLIDTVNSVAQKQQFQPQNTALEIVGVCYSCQKKH